MKLKVYMFLLCAIFGLSFLGMVNAAIPTKIEQVGSLPSMPYLDENFSHQPFLTWAEPNFYENGIKYRPVPEGAYYMGHVVTDRVALDGLKKILAGGVNGNDNPEAFNFIYENGSTRMHGEDLRNKFGILSTAKSSENPIVFDENGWAWFNP